MKKSSQKKFSIAAGFLAAFGVWTAAVILTDVQHIGPLQSAVGMAAINQGFHALTGVHMSLYVLTDWLSLFPISLCIAFAVLGLMQWIRRKQLLRVDFSILMLGLFYLLVLACYFLFEIIVINYRPVLIQGILESSYPSSTTMLVLCIMPTAIMQWNARIQNRRIRCLVAAMLTAFTIFMVACRILSGVHWLSDIVGGVLLSAGLVMLYVAVCSLDHRNS